MPMVIASGDQLGYLKMLVSNMSNSIISVRCMITLHNVLFVQYDAPVSKIFGVFFWNLDSVLL